MKLITPCTRYSSSENSSFYLKPYIFQRSSISLKNHYNSEVKSTTAVVLNNRMWTDTFSALCEGGTTQTHAVIRYTKRRFSVVLNAVGCLRALQYCLIYYTRITDVLCHSLSVTW